MRVSRSVIIFIPCSVRVGLVVDVTLLLDELSPFLSERLVCIFTDLEIFSAVLVFFLGKASLLNNVISLTFVTEIDSAEFT